MALLKSLVGRAIRQVASDPRARQKAHDFVEREVAPRARQAAEQGRDAYRLARDDWRDSAGQPAQESDLAGGEGRDGGTARRAGRFLGKLHNRLNQDPGR